MAQLVRSRLIQLTVKCSNLIVPRISVPNRYQRLCFRTSSILDVKGKELKMPSLSPTMETGTIVKWHKKEGDKIESGDAIADIQTDKAVVTMDADDDGILAKIIVQEGTQNIKVGDLIALAVEPDEDWKNVEMPDDSTVSAVPASAASSTQISSTPEAPQAIPAGQQNISMPALSPTMTTGTIVKWYKKEGDEIQPGDALADIQTDKAVMTFELDDEGVLAKILVPESGQVEVGQLIAVTVEKGMDWTKAVIPSITKTASSTVTTAKPDIDSSTKSSGQVYGLAVKRLLEEYGLNANAIKGTGRPNRLLKGDVLAYIQANNIKKVTPKSAPPPTTDKPASKRSPSPAGKSVPVRPSAYVDMPVSNIRAVIAKRLGESKSTIPHSYAQMDIKIDKLIEIRSELKADDINVSVNDFIIKAVAHALLECPDVNVLYQKNQIIKADKVDVSVAVAAPSGLITPIVFDTPRKSLKEISQNVKELAKKAREGRLKPQEFQGGTFTISNLGMFGIKEFSAIINPPQTAILAVGTGRQELDISLKPCTKMIGTLSYDRRAIDEDQAAEFLSVLRAMLEDPTFLVVGRLQAIRHRRG